MDFLTELEVDYKEKAKLRYKIFRLGADLFVAKLETHDKVDENIQEVYFEKDSEGWKHFTPTSSVETPEIIAEKLLEKVSNYHQGSKTDLLNNTITF